MKEPSTQTIYQIVIANQKEQIESLKSQLRAQEKELQDLAEIVDAMREDYQHLVDEYIDLREDYNCLQSTKNDVLQSTKNLEFPIYSSNLEFQSRMKQLNLFEDDEYTRKII